MAVLIASSLRKEIVGAPLFDGVSFKLERRERLALSGRNGAGKTTLLRILAGETALDGGELSFAKGTRVALHDQRPPLAPKDMSGGQTPGHDQEVSGGQPPGQPRGPDQRPPLAPKDMSGGQTPGH